MINVVSGSGDTVMGCGLVTLFLISLGYFNVFFQIVPEQFIKCDGNTVPCPGVGLYVNDV